MELSKLTSNLIGQPMFNLKKKIRKYELAGKRIYHFEIGDSEWGPEFDVINATVKSLMANETHYTASSGMQELKEQIVKYVASSYSFAPGEDQILVMPANAVIDFVVRCVCNVGDEVITSDPCFPTYSSVLSYVGIKQVRVPIDSETGFNLQAKDVEAKITKKTKLIIVNSPCNPTGGVIPVKDFEHIYNLCVKHKIWLLTDEVYSEMVYDTKKKYSPATVDKCYDCVILLKSFSKTYAMPGYRLGYVIAQKNLIEKMTLLFQTIFSCMPVFIQRGGIAALQSNGSFILEKVLQLHERRNLLVEGLNEINNVECAMPDGAFYVFPYIGNTGMTDEEVADKLLDEAGVAVLPGCNFGPHGKGFIRMCYATSEDNIKEALEKIKKVLC